MGTIALLACATPPPAPPPPILAPPVELEALLGPPPAATPLANPLGLPRYRDIPVATGRCPGLPPGILVSEPVHAEMHVLVGQGRRCRKEADVLARLRREERAAAEDLVAAQLALIESLERQAARERRWAPWRMVMGVAIGAGTMLAASWAAGRVQR